MKTITVIIISYNQENVISRCLDSILVQKDYGLKHIVVSDDCSKDKTWEVLKSYADKYPSIMRINRNESNLGIYPNMEKAVSLRGEADLYCKLSGDDSLCDGWFREIQKYIVENNVDFSMPIGFYSDWKYIYPDGREKITKQDLAGNNYDLFSLYIRGLVNDRSSLINEIVISQYGPLVLGKGLNLTEANYDSQDPRFIKKSYYVPYIGSIYYCGLGVSTTLGIGNSDYFTTQTIEKWKFFIENYIQTESDLWFAKYGIEQANFYLHPSLLRLYRIMLYYNRGRLKGEKKGLSERWGVAFPLVKYMLKYMVTRIVRRING